MDNKDDQDAEHKSDEDEAKKTTQRVGPRSMLEGTEDDKVEYRSISAMSAAAPPAFGRSFGHMHGPALGLPAPFSMRKAASAVPKASQFSAVPAPSTIPMLDTTSYANTSVKPLPAAPFRLELHSHFHVKNSSVQRVCMVIGQKLLDLGTDFVFKPLKGKWKVSKVDGSSMVEFNVALFKTGEAEHVVEFQRRQGDIVSMMHLYGEVAQACKKQQMLTGAGALKPLKHTRPAASPTSPQSAPWSTSDDMKAAVQSIHQMMASHHHDVQIQGILASISLSSVTSTYRDCLSPLVPLLVSLAHSTVDQVKRCASFALARLCNDPECRRAFMNSDGWELVVKLAAGGAGISLDCQRESLHVLEILCPLYSHELSGADGAAAVLTLLQDWQSIPDPRLKKHACGAHHALKAAGMLAQ
ncbi:hypothetical protein DYB37_008561 [Aphanomyces astaci]|uniref:Uncharacterized protein n=2 Tax=Aphanomyces astaci TaxID=112090 RepID=A0A3R6XLN8_APHAT|nr:hypothetical protein DYB35_002485 [Aphanomyces astaci]RHZ16105.1 hypothetical protein DYB37_008561 [Aphanomyces astaci]